MFSCVHGLWCEKCDTYLTEVVLFIAIHVVTLNLFLKGVYHWSTDKTAFSMCNRNNCQASDVWPCQNSWPAKAAVYARLLDTHDYWMKLEGASRGKETLVSIYSKSFGLVVVKVILMTILQQGEGFIHSLLTELTQSSFMERRTFLMCTLN